MRNRDISQEYKIRTDTMLIADRNVFQENRSVMSWKNTYSFTNSRNPLNYVNNFSLTASDGKNAGKSDIFLVFNPEFICYNQVSEYTTKYTSSGGPVEYVNLFTIPTDIFNRVQTISDTSGGNKVTVFEYY